LLDAGLWFRGTWNVERVTCLEKVFVDFEKSLH
jgi:hypothetical protein